MEWAHELQLGGYLPLGLTFPDLTLLCSYPPPLRAGGRMWPARHRVWVLLSPLHGITDCDRGVILDRFSKPGFPGVVIVEGADDSAAEYILRLKQLRWQVRSRSSGAAHASEVSVAPSV